MTKTEPWKLSAQLQNHLQQGGFVMILFFTTNWQPLLRREKKQQSFCGLEYKQTTYMHNQVEFLGMECVQFCKALMHPKFTWHMFDLHIWAQLRWQNWWDGETWNRGIEQGNGIGTRKTHSSTVFLLAEHCHSKSRRPKNSNHWRTRKKHSVFDITSLQTPWAQGLCLQSFKYIEQRWTDQKQLLSSLSLE